MKALKLTEDERRTLDQIRERLNAQGLGVSQDDLILTVLRAFSALPKEELYRLVREGIAASKRQPSNGSG